MEKQPSKFRVLLIEDDEDDYLILKSIFAKIVERPFDLQWSHDYESAKQLIGVHQHDIYLIDYRLGLHNGLELLAHAEPQKRPEPFIILTGVGDEKIEQQAVELGAADYLVKGTFNAELLSRTLRYAVQRKHIEEQRVQHLLEITRAKDEFISLASHQLRTPATGVKQYVGMVLEGFAGAITQMQRSMLEKAYASNERQLHIVTDLLKVAQVDAGRVKLRKQNTDLVQLIGDVLKEQRATFNRRKQKAHFKHRQKEERISVDPDTIRMALENIIDNASKYSPEGKKIEVTLQPTATHYHIHVTDQGVGIATEDKPLLFQKFTRIANPLSTMVGGTGLGLYWAKRIVDLHEGDIKVESRLGKGATFSVILPKK